MALRSFPLTRARFLIATIARANDSPFAHVDESLIDYYCEWASDTIQSAMGDRITQPLLEWDVCLEGHAVMLAWRPVMAMRGYKKDQGRDSEIVELAKVADAYLERLRTKSENPRFVDSGSNFPRDSIQVVSHANSMTALLNVGGRRCC
jgi:hypothetical protein